MTDQVIIIGGGLAGLAAATALAVRGFRVTIVEARNRLGGRASSFTDAASGQLVDNCQHVSMACCTNLAHFCRTVGIAGFLRKQPCLYFMTPDRRVSRFQAACWPAPFHLLPSFLRSHYLSAADKLRIAWGLACLWRSRVDHDLPFQDWLMRHGQTPRTVDRFWGVVLTSALNEVPERIGLNYARKVFVEGFLRNPHGFEVELPTVPLGRLYGRELESWLDCHQVKVLLSTTVDRLRLRNEDAVAAVEMRQDQKLLADWYMSAVPFERLLDLLPANIVASRPYFTNLRSLETSPITSVHVWYDRPVMDLPHVVLIDCIGQWVFNRDSKFEIRNSKFEMSGGPGEVHTSPDLRTTHHAPRTTHHEYYVQVVVSAARQFRGLGHEEVQRRVVEELAHLLPGARTARVCRTRVVTEKSATFSAVPGVDRLRPAQTSPIDNLFVAGDWTATGWPATMEGGVRSGYLAAEALLRRKGSEERLVQADL